MAWVTPECILLVGCTTSVVLIFLILKIFLHAPKNLARNVAIVTGGGNGLGRALCLELVKRQCSIIVWDIDAAGLAQTHRICHDYVSSIDTSAGSNHGVGVLVHTSLVDISSDESVRKAYMEACEVIQNNSAKYKLLYKCPTILINNAGIVLGKDIADLQPNDLQRTFGTNVYSVFNTLRYALPQMKSLFSSGNARNDENGPRCTIVNISSMIGLLGGAMLTDYCASKWAVNGVSESLRLELGRDGFTNIIGVHTVCPYVINTGMFDGIFKSPMEYFNPIRDVFFPPLCQNQTASRIITKLADCHGENAFYSIPGILVFASYLLRLLFPLRVYDILMGYMGGWFGMSSWNGKTDEALSKKVE